MLEKSFEEKLNDHLDLRERTLNSLDPDRLRKKKPSKYLPGGKLSPEYIDWIIENGERNGK